MWCTLTASDGIECFVGKNIYVNQLSLKTHWENLRPSTVACIFQAGVDWDDAMELSSLISKLLIIITLLKTQCSVSFLDFNVNVNHT